MTERQWTREDVEDAVRESTERSSVPFHVEDETAVARLASLRRERAQKAAS